VVETVHTIEACSNCLVEEDKETVHCMAGEDDPAEADVYCSMVHAIPDKQVDHTHGWELVEDVDTDRPAEDVDMDRPVLDRGVAAHKGDMADENIQASHALQEGGYMEAEAENIQASYALQEGDYMVAEAAKGAEEHSVD